MCSSELAAVPSGLCLVSATIRTYKTTTHPLSNSILWAFVRIVSNAGRLINLQALDVYEPDLEHNVSRVEDSVFVSERPTLRRLYYF